MTTLESIKDKNAHLETSLSAETRLKLDLFSALGDAKRQMEIQQGESVYSGSLCKCECRHRALCIIIASNSSIHVEWLGGTVTGVSGTSHRAL